MKRQVFVLQYKDGKFVKRDDSTGPMSTGGYPFPVDSIEDATRWDTIEEAARYGTTCGFRDMHQCVYSVDITYTLSAPIPYPPVWEKCNHHCIRDAVSSARTALHYADCTMMKGAK